ncbi:MAG: C10 family peptidase [Bacteroidota bacterium]
MKRLLFLSLLAFGFLTSCSDETNLVPNDEKQSNPIELRSSESENTIPFQVAHDVATKFTFPQEGSSDGGGGDSNPPAIADVQTYSDKMGEPALYVFNYENDQGYLVVSADWRHEPICAITKAGTFPDYEAPSAIFEWFEATIENIEFIRYNGINNDARGIAGWNKLIDDLDLALDPIPFGSDCCDECPNWPDCLLDPVGCGDPTIHCGDPCGDYVTTIVGPLMSTEWGQKCTYNEQVDDKNCSGVCWSNTRAYTGCVATAMSQIVRYWEINTSHNYNYSTMPDNSGDSEVQRLMSDTGESVDMDYGCSSSGAKSSKVPGALKDDFNFSSANRSGYGSGSYQTVVSNLNAGRPVYLDGCRSKKKFLGITVGYSNCHAWICDGYWRTNNYCYSYLKFYMNWGWNGSHNGWFAFNNWTIPANNRNYQYARDYIYNIYP